MIRSRIMALALVFGVVALACAALTFSPDAAHAASSTFTSVGFDIGWDAASTTPWADLTQDNLFALQTENGTALDTHFLSTVNVPAWVAAAHAHNVTAMITIGGSDDQNWQNACNDTNRAGFVNNLVAYMQSNGFDGIDLDIEDDVWAAQGPPSSQQTTCVIAIYSALQSVKTKAGNTPLLSEDIITNWQGPWAAPYQADISQFNLMTYGDTCTPTCATFASDVSATENEGLPASKFVLGIDVIDSYPVAGDCGKIASYAQQFLGVMTWAIQEDNLHSDACLNQFAPFISSSPSPTATATSTASPSPTSTATLPPTPSPTASPTPTPMPINNVPCTVTINGVREHGRCTGTFTP